MDSLVSHQQSKAIHFQFFWLDIWGSAQSEPNSFQVYLLQITELNMLLISSDTTVDLLVTSEEEDIQRKPKHAVHFIYLQWWSLFIVKNSYN